MQCVKIDRFTINAPPFEIVYVALGILYMFIKCGKLNI